jgi:hypothetical protein
VGFFFRGAKKGVGGRRRLRSLHGELMDNLIAINQFAIKHKLCALTVEKRRTQERIKPSRKALIYESEAARS